METTEADVCPKLDSFSSFSGPRGRGTEGWGSPHLAASLTLFWVCPRRQVQRHLHQLYHNFPWYLSLLTYDWMGRTTDTWHADKCVCCNNSCDTHESLTYAEAFLFEDIHLLGYVGIYEMQPGKCVQAFSLSAYACVCAVWITDVTSRSEATAETQTSNQLSRTIKYHHSLISVWLKWQ